MGLGQPFLKFLLNSMSYSSEIGAITETLLSWKAHVVREAFNALQDVQEELLDPSSIDPTPEAIKAMAVYLASAAATAVVKDVILRSARKSELNKLRTRMLFAEIVDGYPDPVRILCLHENVPSPVFVLK